MWGSVSCPTCSPGRPESNRRPSDWWDWRATAALKVKPFLSQLDLERAIHAFISSRLDYCNALYVGLSLSSISRLQLVQNAVARFLTSTSRCEHFISVLSSLRWLPVRFRIDFKLLLFVFNAMNGLGPSYLSQIWTFLQLWQSLALLWSAYVRGP